MQSSSRRSQEEFYQEMLKFKEVKRERMEVQRKVREEQEMEECRKSVTRGFATEDIHDRLFKQKI